MTYRKINRLREFTELSDHRRAIECPQARLREDRMMEKRDIAISAENLRVGFDELVIQMP